MLHCHVSVSLFLRFFIIVLPISDLQEVTSDGYNAPVCMTTGAPAAAEEARGYRLQRISSHSPTSEGEERKRRHGLNRMRVIGLDLTCCVEMYLRLILCKFIFCCKTKAYQSHEGSVDEV